jgi:hypothetical protein
MYARLHEGHWSAPTELLASPAGGVTTPAVALDTQGFLHLIWKNEGDVSLAYSRAHVSQAGIAGGRFWATPENLSNGVLAPGGFGSPFAIATEPGDLVHLVYATMEGGLYYKHSVDGGQSWSSPTAITESGSSKTSPDLPRLLVGDQGELNVTWTELQLPDGWPPTGTYASRSDDHGQTWAAPVRITGDGYALVNMAQTGPKTLHRVWDGLAAIGERRHQWSGDDGLTWTQPASITPTLSGGLTGYPALGVDSAGGLHLATAVEGGIYYLAWDGTRWSQPVRISQGAIGKRSIEQPVITLSEGNRLHVVWEDDFERIWYTTRVVDAPTLPIGAIPPAPTKGQIPPQPIDSAAPPSTMPRVIPEIGAGDFSTSAEPAVPLLAGIIPSLIVIGAIALSRATRQS